MAGCDDAKMQLARETERESIRDCGNQYYDAFIALEKKVNAGHFSHHCDEPLPVGTYIIMVRLLKERIEEQAECGWSEEKMSAGYVEDSRAVLVGKKKVDAGLARALLVQLLRCWKHEIGKITYGGKKHKRDASTSSPTVSPPRKKQRTSARMVYTQILWKFPKLSSHFAYFFMSATEGGERRERHRARL